MPRKKRVRMWPSIRSRFCDEEYFSEITVTLINTFVYWVNMLTTAKYPSFKLMRQKNTIQYLMFSSPLQTQFPATGQEPSKAVKWNYFSARNKWLKNDPAPNFFKFGFLITSAAVWSKTATVGIASDGFPSCDIFPRNANDIPDYIFAPVKPLGQSGNTSRGDKHFTRYYSRTINMWVIKMQVRRISK